MARRHPITEAEGEIIAEMRERGRSFDAIARKIGCSFGSVSWYCLKNGIDPPKPRALRPDAYLKNPVIRRGMHEVRPFTPEEDEQLIALERKGLRKAAIARALKRRPNSVTGRLMTLGHQGRAEVLIPALTLDQCLDFYEQLVGGMMSPEMYPHGHAWMRRIKHAYGPGHPTEHARAMFWGWNLACWCKLPAPGEPDRCHAAVLLKIVNPETAR